MPTGPASDALDDRLEELAQAVRRQRIRSGIALTLIAASTAAVGLAVLDAQFFLSVLTRCIAGLCASAAIIALGWRLIRRPVLADPPIDEVAERIASEGTPNVVVALAREAKEHRVFPAWPSYALTVLAALVVLGTVGLAVNSGDRVKRLALPWHRPAIAAPFEIVVVSGDTVARRGEPITLSAYLKPRDPNLALPEAATLRLRDSEVNMTGSNGAYHATLPPTDRDFEYRVEVGGEASDWFSVRIADAVELTPETSIQITPPEYLAGVVKVKNEKFANLEAVQFSTATLHLKFTRPAESASIEWRPEGRNPFDAPDAFTVSLSADRRSGTAAVPLRATGVLRVVMQNEAGPRRLRTESPLSVKVTPDAPPEFERVEGLSTYPRTVRPGQEIRVLFVAVDDFAIQSAVLEFEQNTMGGVVPLLLDQAGQSRTEGRGVVRVPDLDGAMVRYRLRVRDSRQIPSENRAAQEAVFPASGWFQVRVTNSGVPFHEQQIRGQRDDIQAVLQAVREPLEASKSSVADIRHDSAGVSPLPLDQSFKINVLRESFRTVRLQLEQSARQTALTIETRGLAQAERRLSDRIREADESLQQAITDDPAARAAHLAACLSRVEATLAELERTASENDRLAQDRVDRFRLQELERRQAALATRPIEPEATVQAQRELLAELKRIIAESEPLSRAVAALASNDSARLGGEMQRLLARLRGLEAAAQRLHAETRRGLLAESVAVQEGVAKRVRTLGQELDSPARIAALTKLDPERFERVVQLLQQDQIVETLVELERLATSLEKLATECEGWSKDRSDAKLAASQFSRWQSDLRTRYLADPKISRVQEQAAILEATEKLHVPVDAVALREGVLVHLRLAKRRLERDAAEADVAMKFAAEAFDRMAMKLPSVPERLARARTDLDKLRIEQDAIITASERILQTFDKLQFTAPVMQNIAVKLAPVRTRQLRLLEKVTALDLPHHVQRQARVVHAIQSAAADLKDGLPLDVGASLGAARRELDRLKQALENQTPADVRTVELAAKQSDAMTLVLAAGENADVKQWEPIIASQTEIAAALGNLAASEAPALLHEAREAAQAAESSLRDGSKHETIVRRIRDSKEALLRLADRLNDREPERDRVRSWISARRTAECGAKKFAGKPLNPDASALAREELKRELDELLMTRVGAAAQAAKRKCLEQSLRLQNRPEPDRQAADQKQLADALAELASLMAGDVELSTRPDAIPGASSPADKYLPTRHHAIALREAARSERELREQINGLAAAVNRMLTAAPVNPLAKLEARQRALADSLAVAVPQRASLWQRARALQAVALARAAADALAVGEVAEASQAARECFSRLKLEAQQSILAELDALKLSPTDQASQIRARHATLAGQARELRQQFTNAIADAVALDPSFTDAVDVLQTVERTLTDATRKSFSDGSQLRREAILLLATAAPKGEPKESPPTTAISLAVRDAERAMLRAIRELGPKGDRNAAKEAMNRAAAALKLTP